LSTSEKTDETRLARTQEDAYFPDVEADLCDGDVGVAECRNRLSNEIVGEGVVITNRIGSKEDNSSGDRNRSETENREKSENDSSKSDTGRSSKRKTRVKRRAKDSSPVMVRFL
jgi:hypothetical protein